MRAKMEHLTIPAFDNENQMMAAINVTNDKANAFGTFIVRLDRDENLDKKEVERLAVGAVKQFLNNGEELTIEG